MYSYNVYLKYSGKEVATYYKEDNFLSFFPTYFEIKNLVGNITRYSYKHYALFSTSGFVKYGDV